MKGIKLKFSSNADQQKTIHFFYDRFLNSKTSYTDTYFKNQKGIFKIRDFANREPMALFYKADPDVTNCQHTYIYSTCYITRPKDFLHVFSNFQCATCVIEVDRATYDYFDVEIRSDVVNKKHHYIQVLARTLNSENLQEVLKTLDLRATDAVTDTYCGIFGIQEPNTLTVMQNISTPNPLSLSVHKRPPKKGDEDDINIHL